MNVTCPECTTVFRIDPAKVPERGVRARCSVCGGLIAVRRPDPIAPRPELAPPPVHISVPAAAPTSPAADPPHAVPPSAVPPPVVPPPVERTAPAHTPLGNPAQVPLSALPDEHRPQPKAAPAPLAPPPPHATSHAGPAAAKFSNPFLQQDPTTRARRLARALVSDLVVYHPEKRQRGLIEGNLKELFAEEIRKSWEEYTEQVGDDVARTTPYFTEALNEILAEGRTLFG